MTITTMAEARNRLRFNCTACETMCEHVGAAVSLVLEEKTALGLAAAPDERRPLETLSEQELLEQALRDRQERARTEKFRLASSDPRAAVGRLHDHQRAVGQDAIAWRCGARSGAIRICSCPDFRTNTLGTCKHILHVLHRVRRRFPAAARRKPYRNREAFVHVLYGEEVTLHLQLPDRPDAELVEGGRLAGRRADRRRAAAGRLPGAAGSPGPQHHGLSRRRGVDPAAAVRAAHVATGWPRSERTRRGIRSASNC